MTRRWWLVAALLTVMAVHGLVVARSAGHLERGRRHAADGAVREAGREYQSAIGYHAPFNPYCERAAEELHGLIRSVEGTDLAADLEDRRRRSLSGGRWLLEPHPLGDRPVHGGEDPNPLLALVAATLLALAGWLIAFSGGRRWTVWLLAGGLIGVGLLVLASA